MSPTSGRGTPERCAALDAELGVGKSYRTAGGTRQGQSAAAFDAELGGLRVVRPARGADHLSWSTVRYMAMSVAQRVPGHTGGSSHTRCAFATMCGRATHQSRRMYTRAVNRTLRSHTQRESGCRESCTDSGPPGREADSGRDPVAVVNSAQLSCSPNGRMCSPNGGSHSTGSPQPLDLTGKRPIG